MHANALRLSASPSDPTSAWARHAMLRGPARGAIIPADSGYRILVPRRSAWVHVHGFAPVVASPCSALFLGPDDRIDGEPLGDGPFVADLVRLPDDGAETWRPCTLGTPSGTPARRFPMPWARVGADAFIALRLLLQNASPDGPDGMALSAWAHWLLRCAQAEWRKRPVPLQPVADRSRFTLAQATARVIENHWRENRGLEDISAGFGISVFHLLRAFRRTMGQTPHQYLLQLRLRRSLDLIVSGNQRIVDAALATGFCSHGHYSSAFRNAFGMSPVEFSGQRRYQARQRNPETPQ